MGRPKKYTDSEKVENRRKYEQSRGGDLTSYGALLGEQFTHKVNLLAQLIRDAHEYSLGRYKEKLLAKAIEESLPKRYAVGTGFVLFPKTREFARSEPPDFDHINKGDHEVSLQCDLIIYDQSEYPVIFRDEDFVVGAPEAVRAVVEVKGSLDAGEIDAATNHLIDFGRKWHRCNAFYSSHFQGKLHDPKLFLMAWQIAVNPDGTPKIDGKRARERIVERYRSVQAAELEAFPYLNSAFVYNNFEVRSTSNLIGSSFQLGWWTCGGKLLRYDRNNEVREEGDGTVAGLIGDIHCALEVPFNRFVSRKDQCSPPQEFSVSDFTVWLEDEDSRKLRGAERQKSQP